MYTYLGYSAFNPDTYTYFLKIIHISESIKGTQTRKNATADNGGNK